MNEFDKIWNQTMGCGACDVKPSEDCISRQAVLEQAIDFGLDTFFIPLRLVKELPSVYPERPKGKWIYWTDDYKDYCTCSECGYGEEGEVLLKDKTPYCPYCGAEMEVEKNEADN